MNKLNARFQSRRKMQRYQPSIKDLGTLAYMGAGNGLLLVPNRPGYVYVTVGDSPPFPVFNKRVQPVAGLPVIIGYDPNEPWLLQVLTISTQSSDGSAGTGSVTAVYNQTGPHGYTHSATGTDPVWVNARQIVDGRVNALAASGSNVAQVDVMPAVVLASGSIVSIPYKVINLTTDIPATAGYGVYDLISIPTSGSTAGIPMVTSGSPAAALTPALTLRPSIPVGNIGLAYVRLYNGMTRVNDSIEYTDILDLRSPIINGQFVTIQDRAIYGAFHCEDAAIAITCTLGEGNYYPVTSGMTGGECRGIIFSAASQLTITSAGLYEIKWSMSFSCNNPNEVIEGILLAGAAGTTPMEQCASSSKVYASASVAAAGASTLLRCAVGDILRLGVEDETSAGKVVTVNHASMVVRKIGAL